jgi:hypothetical protein
VTGVAEKWRALHQQQQATLLHPHTTVHNSIHVYYSSGPSGVGPSVAVVATHLSQECKTQAETVSGSG